MSKSLIATMKSPWILLTCSEFLTILTVALASSDAACPSPNGGEDLKPQRREVYDGGRIFDISHRLRPDMPAWGSKDGLGQFLWLSESMKNGSYTNNSEMKLPIHTGTHVDAPGHVFDRYFDAGFDADSLDLGLLNGPALLVDVPRDENITGRLMWKKEFDTSYVGFTKDGAQWLVENTDIKLVEGRDIIIVECLKLDDIQVGIYSVHCLPLRLLGAEGSPTRCILIKWNCKSPMRHSMEEHPERP
ncbi:unnamed protein product [Camellia sinensis]